MTINVDNLSHEMGALNRVTLERVKILDTQASQKRIRQFHSGTRVYFASTCEDHPVGTSIKLDQKAVTVIDQDGEHGNASRQVLSPPGTRQVETSLISRTRIANNL